jgi:serine phosphatase RsbU (regulator of sigma subunit)
MEYTEQRCELRRGDLLALFTDGVTEAHTSGELLGSEGVQEVLRTCGDATALETANAIYNRALDYSGGNLKDDVAIVTIRVGEPRT